MANARRMTAEEATDKILEMLTDEGKLIIQMQGCNHIYISVFSQNIFFSLHLARKEEISQCVVIANINFVVMNLIPNLALFLWISLLFRFIW